MLKRKPFQILCLSGGGYCGLYIAYLLAELEENTKTPIAKHFDLLCGTSIGGIIALGLTLEIPARSILESFEQYGEEIFSSRRAPRKNLSHLREFTRSLFSSKYSAKGLRRVTENIVGKETILGAAKHRLIIPTVNLTKGGPQIFKTPHHPNFKRDWEIPMVDVAMATSAAPTFFPVAEINDQLFADGGLFANAPDFLGLHEAEHFLAQDRADIWMLSIGTTTANFSFSHEGKRGMGTFQWTIQNRLISTILGSQQQLTYAILNHVLKSKYLRIDSHKSKEQERDLGLDVATPSAQKTIRGLAEAAFRREINDTPLKTFLSHAAQKPKFYAGPNCKKG